MLERFLRVLSGLVVLGVVGSGQVLAQTSTVVSIPESLQGFYSLDMVNAVVGSPISNTSQADTSDNILLYVNPYGTLCTRTSSSSTIQVISNRPVLQGGPFGAVEWDVAPSGLRFSLNINTTTFNGFDLYSTSGTLLGRLVGGAPQFDTGSCGTVPLNGRENTFFSLAEGVYPAFFPASSFVFNQIGDGFDVYRYYPSTEVYLAIRNNEVYARGGDFGDELAMLGTLSDLINDINAMPVPNQVPAFYQGTFLLSLDEVQPFSPLAEGTQLNFVVTDTGRLCVEELNLSFPVVSGNTATWNNSRGNLRYRIDLTRDDDPEEYDAELGLGQFLFQSFAGSTYGVFLGEKTSLATDCAGATGQDPDLQDINTFFALIEEQYPSVFPSGPQTYTQKSGRFTYRYYYATQVFVAVRDGMVYLNGGQFGSHDEPVAYDTLSALLAQLNNTALSAVLPTSIAGTYAMNFSSGSSFSPFADGASAQVVLDAAGNLCLDGVPFGAAVGKTSTPTLAYWESADTGLSISLDPAANTAGLRLQLSSLSGLSYSLLAGSRVSLATACSGNTTATDMTMADQLFALAEQHYATLFPASLVSFNQMEGNTVHRYYPATGMTLSITGESVSVKGGNYGNSLLPVGNLSELINQITGSGATDYNLLVTGTGRIVMSSTTINRKVDFKRSGVTRPDSTDTVAMQALVRSNVSTILPTIDSISIVNISESSTTMSFTAVVTGDTNISGTTRNYTLLFELSRL